MTIVGSKRMIVYDDVAPLEKIRIFDMRVERPPHYDTFAEFHFAYHYGDVYAPYIKQEEPLKAECQHFLDCIRNGATPVSDGVRGLDVVRILEASSESMQQGGAAVELKSGLEGDAPALPASGRPVGLVVPKVVPARVCAQKPPRAAGAGSHLKVHKNGTQKNGARKNGPKAVAP
jgi:hypothetical protein